jgi:hypothetical protein
MGYSKKITNLLSQKRKDGFEVARDSFDKSERVAQMVAFYGYIFIASLEELWNQSTKESLEDIDKTIKQLIDIINKKLDERKKEIKSRS